MNKENLKFLIAVVVITAGLGMLVAGIVIPPIGIIDNSILIAFGEIATFSGTILGVDTHYKSKTEQFKKEIKDSLK